VGSYNAYVRHPSPTGRPGGRTTDEIRHIASTRYPIPDVPVLYLIEPSPTNLKAITADLCKGLYSPAYINFLSSIPRPLLEDFAAQTATAGTSESIAQVYDQYLNFIVSEPDLFSLGMQKDNSYWALNSARTKDEELDCLVDRIVSGLFSVVVTMGLFSHYKKLPALLTSERRYTHY
jgi:sec1 family domain-containing protein 1